MKLLDIIPLNKGLIIGLGKEDEFIFHKDNIIKMEKGEDYLLIIEKHYDGSPSFIYFPIHHIKWIRLVKE